MVSAFPVHRHIYQRLVTRNTGSAIVPVYHDQQDARQTTSDHKSRGQGCLISGGHTEHADFVSALISRLGMTSVRTMSKTFDLGGEGFDGPFFYSKHQFLATWPRPPPLPSYIVIVILFQTMRATAQSAGAFYNILSVSRRMSGPSPQHRLPRRRTETERCSEDVADDRRPFQESDSSQTSTK